ncbi:MAG: hypothetical protein ACRCT8_00975 [Lacipirellulaceae bacterium]
MSESPRRRTQSHFPRRGAARVVLLFAVVASLGVGPYATPRDCCCENRARQGATAKLAPCCAKRLVANAPAAAPPTCCQRPDAESQGCCADGSTPCQCAGCPSDAPVEPLAPAPQDTSSSIVEFATYCPTPIAPLVVRTNAPSRLADWRRERGESLGPAVRELFCVWVI